MARERGECRPCAGHPEPEWVTSPKPHGRDEFPKEKPVDKLEEREGAGQATHTCLPFRVILRIK